MTFRGTFEHALDAKHRLTIPARFRDALKPRLVLAAAAELERGAPKCVSIWRPEDYDEFARRTLGSENPSSPRARQLQRFLYNNSFDAELDSANRLMIPPFLMDYAGLSKDVVVTGSGDCLEVWDREAYRRNLEEVLDRIPDLAASLGDTG